MAPSYSTSYAIIFKLWLHLIAHHMLPSSSYGSVFVHNPYHHLQAMAQPPSTVNGFATASQASGVSVAISRQYCSGPQALSSKSHPLHDFTFGIRPDTRPRGRAATRTPCGVGFVAALRIFSHPEDNTEVEQNQPQYRALRLFFRLASCTSRYILSARVGFNYLIWPDILDTGPSATSSSTKKPRPFFSRTIGIAKKFAGANPARLLCYAQQSDRDCTPFEQRLYPSESVKKILFTRNCQAKPTGDFVTRQEDWPRTARRKWPATSSHGHKLRPAGLETGSTRSPEKTRFSRLSRRFQKNIYFFFVLYTPKNPAFPVVIPSLMHIVLDFQSIHYV